MQKQIPSDIKNYSNINLINTHKNQPYIKLIIQKMFGEIVANGPFRP
jgi:predicted lipase